MTRTRNNLIQIIKTYRKYTQNHQFCNRVRDRFGYWSKKQFYRLPEYTELSLEEASIERAKILGNKNILWSGGVDSTFTVCAYIKAKVPFTVICDNTSITDGTYFYEWMLRHNIPIKRFNSILEAYYLKSLLHSDIADLLFAPDDIRHITLDWNKSFYENMSHLSNRDVLYEQILEYGKLLRKPTDSIKHISRLINFGAFYTHGRDEYMFCIHPLHRWTAFFDTETFNDISWSQYWERDVYDDKPEMHRFICEVTQDEDMMYKVYRTWTNLAIKRKSPIKENYIRFQSRY